MSLTAASQGSYQGRVCIALSESCMVPVYKKETALCFVCCLAYVDTYAVSKHSMLQQIQRLSIDVIGQPSTPLQRTCCVWPVSGSGEHCNRNTDR